MEAINSVLRVGSQSVLLYNQDNGDEPASGHVAIILRLIAERLKVTQIKESFIDTFGFGELISETNGTGSIGYLLRNEYDMSSLDPTDKSILLLDFTRPTLLMNWKILSKNPKLTFENNINSTLEIFDSITWISFIISCLLVPLFFAFTSITDGQNKWQFGKTYLQSFAVLLRQGFTKPKGTFQRLSWITWDIACFILTSAFSGVLLSKLTLPALPERFDTLEDILKHKDANIYIVKDSEPYNAFKTSNQPVFKAIWKRVHQRNTLIDYEHFDVFNVFDRLKKEKGLSYLLPHEMILETMRIVEICNDLENRFYFSKSVIHISKFAYAMRKSLPFSIRQRMKNLISRFIEGGYLDLSIQQELWKCQSCVIKQGDSDDDVTKLTINCFISAFILLGLGLIAAILVLIYEMITLKNKNNNNVQVQPLTLI